jgi:hypothetical protein
VRVEYEEQGVSYTWALRALGAYLDEHGAHEVTVLETPDGVVATYCSKMGGDERALAEFSLDEMIAFRTELEHRRAAALARAGKMTNAVPATPEPGRYQDVLRALGWELDDQRAYNILVQELDEEMLVTYDFLDPRDNYLPFKVMVRLGQQELEGMMTAAYRRRRLEPVQGRGIWDRLNIVSS